MKPLVSVIIPNYNYANYLAEAIDSVLAQTYSNVEIIVVDDGSTDNSKEVLSNYGEKIKCLFQNNKGVSTARNIGVANSEGSLITFLDADDVWTPEKISSQVNRFDVENSEIGMVHVGVQDIDADGKELNGHTDGLSGRVSNDLLFFERSVILGGGSGIMTSRRIFDEVGGFDPQLSTSADWDFFYRICSRYDVAFIATKLLKYRFHNSNMHGNIPRMEREMLYGFRKAFDSADAETLKLKSRAYGNFHRVLSGSYFQAGNYQQFVKHALKSIWNRPGNLGYFLKFPLRRLSKNPVAMAPGSDK